MSYVQTLAAAVAIVVIFIPIVIIAEQSGSYAAFVSAMIPPGLAFLYVAVPALIYFTSN